jgi:hypothetical protein
MPTIEFTGRGSTARGGPAASALARAAVAARQAPSIFNSQPWRWRIGEDTAELRADRTRQLTTVDPDGRMLMLSCGAALDHAVTALAGAGAAVAVERLPDAADPDLVARLRVTGFHPAEPTAVRRQQAIALRRTDRRPVADVEVPELVLGRLRDSAEGYGAHLHVLRPADVASLTVAVSRAAELELDDPEYRAELTAWTSRPAEAHDGVAAGTVAHLLPRRVPLRDFGLAGPMPYDGGAVADRYARYAVLLADDDEPAGWLAAGEALSAVLLTATLERLAASPLSDVVEVPAARQVLRALVGGVGQPVLALRFGVPGEDGPAPESDRRPVAEVIDLS